MLQLQRKYGTSFWSTEWRLVKVKFHLRNCMRSLRKELSGLWSEQWALLWHWDIWFLISLSSFRLISTLKFFLVVSLSGGWFLPAADSYRVSQRHSIKSRGDHPSTSGQPVVISNHWKLKWMITSITRLLGCEIPIHDCLSFYFQN